jgi:hypothetical protein
MSRLPFFRAFAPRIGFVTGPIGRHHNAHAIDTTTLLPEHHPLAEAFAILVLLVLAMGLYFLAHP